MSERNPDRVYSLHFSSFFMPPGHGVHAILGRVFLLPLFSMLLPDIVGVLNSITRCNRTIPHLPNRVVQVQKENKKNVGNTQHE